jgi:hypothetical protein
MEEVKRTPVLLHRIPGQIREMRVRVNGRLLNTEPNLAWLNIYQASKKQGISKRSLRKIP